MKIVSYLFNVWHWVESTLVAHHVFAFCAGVIVGRIFWPYVECNLTEGTCRWSCFRKTVGSSYILLFLRQTVSHFDLSGQRGSCLGGFHLFLILLRLWDNRCFTLFCWCHFGRDWWSGFRIILDSGCYQGRCWTEDGGTKTKHFPSHRLFCLCNFSFSSPKAK